MESNWVWMTESGNSFHAASNLYPTSSTILTEEERRTSLLVIHNQMFSRGNRSGDRASQGNNRIPCVQRKLRTGVQDVVLHYLVGRWRLVGSDDRAQPLDVRCQKCTDLRSNYHRSELETYLKAVQAIGVIPLCRYRMQADEEWSPWNLQTCTLPSEYCTQNRDSSEKTTLCHCCIQLCRFAHRTRHLSL
ncbi:hypothetical protein TNCV_1346501 [Trichonephila clavipes]|nr:hypothetical protein TNCV_1346501 [Trichonephila clavipes]